MVENKGGYNRIQVLDYLYLVEQSLFGQLFCLLVWQVLRDIARILTRTSFLLKRLLKPTYFIYKMTAIILSAQQKRFQHPLAT